MTAKDRVIEAARALVAGKTSTFKARNGRDVGIEADDGEKCYIVHSDLICALEGALSDYDKRRAELLETAKGATGG